MRRSTSGFTLLEMLLVLTIIGIMATIALPAMVSAIASVRISGEINTLLGGLNFARSEAIKRGQIVSVCPANGTACATGNAWSSGWLVLLNSTPTQELLVSPGVTYGDSLTSTTGNNPPYPQFTPAGYTFFTGTLSLHDQNSTQSLYRCIVFSAGSWVTKNGASCP